MISHRPSIDDPEVKRIVVKNIWSESIPRGGTCVWAPSYRAGYVSRPSTATLSLFAGIAIEEIAPQVEGVIVGYGFVETLVDLATPVATAGRILVPVNAQFYARDSGASDGKSGFIVSADSWVAGVGTGLRWCFVRGM